MLELILIRHGETMDNIKKIYMGHSNSPLSKNGKKQAKQLKKIISKEIFDAVYSSDLGRCMETAALLRLKINIIQSKNLREMNFGIVEGLNRMEFYRKYPDVAKKWDEDWFNYQIPEGESFKITNERVVKQIEEIKSVYAKGKIAIITHSGCIRLILANYLIKNPEGFWNFSIDNAAISRLCFDKDYAYLKSLNER